MTASERGYILILALVLIGSVLWFSAELGWIDRDGDTSVLDFVFGDTESKLPAWEVAIVQMINKLFPGIALFVLVVLASIAYQERGSEK